MTSAMGFTPEEIDTAGSTRSARLKWVVVVDAALPPGRAVNAAVCVASATASAVGGLLGPAPVDADGGPHAGLPWAGCTVLGAPAEQLGELRARALSAEEVHVADMPVAAQLTRVYDEFTAAVRNQAAGQLDYLALSIVGPRNRVDKLVKRLALLP